MIYGMVMQVVGIVAAVFILRAGWGIAGLLGWTITAATMNLCFFTAHANRMLPRETAPIEIRPVLRVAGAAWISGICAQLLQKEMDVLVLNVFRIPWEAIAAYSLGASLGVTLGSLTHGTGPLFQGALSEAAQRGERGLLGAIWQMAIKTSAVLWVPPLFFVFVFAPELIIAFWGPGFREAAWVFRWMALSQVTAALLGEAFAGSLFFAVGRERLALVLRLMAVGLNVMLDFALIPQFGIVGAMIGTSTAFAAVAIAEMSFVYRLTGVLPPIRFLGKWLAAFGLAGLSAVFVPGVGWWVWAGRLAVYSVVAVSLLRIFRPLEAEERELLMRHVPAGRWVFANR
jgi:O-antigen/teichoic acid export membrane protein